jgi:multiple sugar transport system permease protein
VIPLGCGWPLARHQENDVFRRCFAILLLCLAGAVARADAPGVIRLRAAVVPEAPRADAGGLAEQAIMDAFQARFPGIMPVSSAGLRLPGRTAEILPLMQIAGDIPAHVMYVNFRQSDTYIRNRFLYPLDRYIERAVGATIPGGALLSTPAYRLALKQGPRYEEEIGERVPERTWDVMRRRCPLGNACTYLKQWGAPAAPEHYHVWCLPISPSVISMFYRRDLLSEANLPDRAPRDLEEMVTWARLLTHPGDDRYGLRLDLQNLAWSTLSFLYSMGGRVVEQDARGDWRCVFDSEEAVEAYTFVAALFLERYRNDAGEQQGVVYTGQSTGGDIKYGLEFRYLRSETFAELNPALWSHGPVPCSYRHQKDAAGRFVMDPGGELVPETDPASGQPIAVRGSEFNAQMLGIYAGLEDQDSLRDAAWEYIRFYDGPEAKRIRTRIFVENGMAHFVRPPLLVAAGYGELVKLVPRGWEESYQEALAGGVPEPYGANCQLVYEYVKRGISQICSDARVKRSFDDQWQARLAIERATAPGEKQAATARLAAARQAAKDRIREILRDRVARSNEKMLGRLTPEEQRRRNAWGWVAAVAIFLVFTWVIRHVLRVFSRAHLALHGNNRKLARQRLAYLLLIPALASIGLWSYVPLGRGLMVAFQDYNVRGFTEWAGIANFANVLWDDEFWYSMWISLKYAAYLLSFGFAAPIILAFLLSEVPRGKMLYRTLFYLPAVLTGVVIMFLWLGFYGRNGMVNQMLNHGIHLLNAVLGWALSAPLKDLQIDWLAEPRFALLACVLPGIWAGMGPGCLIYLAALKTVPEEVYEAADIDGAGITQKFWHVAIPSIRSLIAINFIGAVIAAMHSGGGMMLALTGGGPYQPYGETEVVGLHIFYTAYGYLRFGSATSMAWILGSLLVGFTVLRLKKLSRMEFRAAGGVPAAGEGR